MRKSSAMELNENILQGTKTTNNSKKCLRSINSIKNIIKKPVLIRLF